MLHSIVHANTYELNSPINNLFVSFSLIDGSPHYSLSVDGKMPVKQSKLGLKLDKPFNGKFKVVDIGRQEVNETYEMQWWKNRGVINHCNEMIVSLEELSESPKKLDIIFRAYNDGIAVRYSFPEQENLNDFVIEEDETEFAFADDYTWWSANGERDNLGPLSINTAKDAVYTPMVLQCADDLYLGIHEAAIYDFANFKIKRANKQDAFQCDLQGSSNAMAGMHTSWRVILVGKTPGDLLESNLLVNLNPPCKIEDTSWIKTGLSMWDWRVWGYTAPDGFVYGLNTSSHKRAIDFASENNIDFLLMDADWYGPEFSKNSDPTKSNKEIDIKENLRYAKEKGVGIILYLNDIGAKKFGLERVLKQFSDWGAAGVKYGFMVGTGQQKVLQTRRIVKLCARYKLTVNFHDNPIPPSGDERTWPNVVTREYCHSQADSKYSYYPETAVSSAFINQLSGPTDMCSGWYGFEGNEVRHKVFRFIPGTVAAENAKLVVFFSGISVLPDAPEEYMRKADLFEFIKKLPNSFEEIKVLDGDIESFITVAKRSGENWYLGSLTTREPRTITIKLDFLSQDTKYKATLFEDSRDTHFIKNRESYQLRQLEVTEDTELKVWLAPGGGNAILIEPVE
jgi:Glycoside hydrolase 97/Glycosyl-hydrolase 97 N-terminal/Glycosyl-hydrolase 97 C-terminal, oligomerisation